MGIPVDSTAGLVGTGSRYTYDAPTGLAPRVGIESVFEFNGLILNDRSSADMFSVSNVAGLGSGELRTSQTARSSSHGEVPEKALYSGRTLVLSGKIRAGRLDKLRDMGVDLGDAWSDPNERYKLWVRGGNGIDKDVWAWARPAQAAQRDEQQADYQFERPFQLSFRLLSPCFYSITRRVSYAYGSAGVVTNRPINVQQNGNFESRPLIVINGPINFPVVQNHPDGNGIALDVQIPAGRSVHLDCDNKVAVWDDGTNAYDAMSDSSKWLRVRKSKSGNGFSFSGEACTDDTLVAVYYNDGWQV